MKAFKEYYATALEFHGHKCLQRHKGQGHRRCAVQLPLVI